MTNNDKPTKPIPTKKPKRKKHRIYRCSICDSPEHRANNHYKVTARASDTLLSLTGDDALRALIVPEMALYIVLADQLETAMTGAIKGQQKAPGSSTAMINAFTRLSERASGIKPKALADARAAWARLQRAEAEYEKAIAPIKSAIVPKGAQS